MVASKLPMSTGNNQYGSDVIHDFLPDVSYLLTDASAEQGLFGGQPDESEEVLRFIESLPSSFSASREPLAETQCTDPSTANAALDGTSFPPNAPQRSGEHLCHSLSNHSRLAS